MQCEVDRDDLHRTRVLDDTPRALTAAEARLQIDDLLDDNGIFDATTVVVSSDSSKTAIRTAYQLSQGAGIRVVGLMREGDIDFVRSLSCGSTHWNVKSDGHVDPRLGYVVQP